MHIENKSNIRVEFQNIKYGEFFYYGLGLYMKITQSHTAVDLENGVVELFLSECPVYPAKAKLVVQ